MSTMFKPSRKTMSDRLLTARFFRALRLNHAEAWDWTSMMLVFLSINVGILIALAAFSIDSPRPSVGVAFMVFTAAMCRREVKDRTEMVELVSQTDRVGLILFAGFVAGLATGAFMGAVALVVSLL